MILFRKNRIENQPVEEAREQSTSLSLYFDAYNYSLELCEDPEIARQVASCFLERVVGKSDILHEGAELA